MKKDEHNCCVDLTEIIPTEKELEVPPRKFAVEMGTASIIDNGMVLTHIGKYDFVKKEDGQIYRVGDNGIEYPPLTQEQFNKLKKAQQIKQETSKQSVRESAKGQLQNKQVPNVKSSDDDLAK